MEQANLTPEGIQKDFGIALKHTQTELLMNHLRYVIQKNEYINLTRIDTISSGIDLHIKDSLLFCKYIKGNTHERFLDLGTGAGYPGIPFGLATGLNGVLLDSIQKKVVALRDIIEKLNLTQQFKVCAERAEVHAKENKYSIVIARAVSKAGSLLELSSPLLVKDGLLILSKGINSNEEIEHSKAVGQLVGMNLVIDEQREIPGTEIKRRMLVYQKYSESKIPLPRKNGMAQRKPL